ncbi:hypothetical protein COOONC_06627 [Cooperia oncophora]
MVTLTFARVVRLIEIESKIDFLFSYKMDWIDERLKWSPNEYCGITHIYTDFEDVWVPEVSIVNA